MPVETCLVVAEDRRERRVLDFLEVATATLREPVAELAAVG